MIASFVLFSTQQDPPSIPFLEADFSAVGGNGQQRKHLWKLISQAKHVIQSHYRGAAQPSIEEISALVNELSDYYTTLFPRDPSSLRYSSGGTTRRERLAMDLLFLIQRLSGILKLRQTTLKSVVADGTDSPDIAGQHEA